MARQRSASTRSRSRLTKHPAKQEPLPPGPDSFAYPTLVGFLENGHGHLQLGHLPWSGFGAIAADDDVTYAALSRRDGESIPELMIRLERALTAALDDDTLIDEFTD